MVSSSSSSSRITFNGLVSGLDTTKMIQQLIDAQKGPITMMQSKVNLRKQQSNAVRDVNNRLTNLLTKVKNFASASYIQARSADVTAGGATATVSATADATASVGSFSVQVNHLADATRTGSASALTPAIDKDALLKNAKLGVAVTAGTFTVNGASITVDPETQTLQQVMDQISAAAGVTGVALVPDGSGRNNLLQISGGAAVTLGSGADTSNFLGAMNLLASPSGATRTSTANLGVLKTGALLQDVQFAAGALTASGSFKVNGAEIAYNAAQDSLSSVITRINNSTAGVTASYDAVNDKINLVSRTTGSVAIGLEDVSGNFLARAGLLGATQTLGTNAQYTINTGNGPVTRYSTTNTVTDAIPGVTLALKQEGASADTVNVAQDFDTAAVRVKDLVNQFNSALDFIATSTTFNKDAANGTLAGDTTITQISDMLRRLVTEPIDGVTTGKTTLSSIGISFGAIGSAIGTTKLLQFDEAKFTEALRNDPAGVATLLSGFKVTATHDTGGTGSVQDISGEPSAVRKPGKYLITTALNGDGTAQITAVFTPTDGGAAVTSTAERVAAGAKLTTLIPGTSITVTTTLAAGTDAITVATPTRGLGAKLEQFLDPTTRSDGPLGTRQTQTGKDIERLNTQIATMNDRLDRTRDRMQQKFALMEKTIARMQAQKSALAAMTAG